jgi:hypothetical protein
MSPRSASIPGIPCDAASPVAGGAQFFIRDKRESTGTQLIELYGLSGQVIYAQAKLTWHLIRYPLL